MSFSVSNTGSIISNFTNTLNEAFGGASGGGNPNKYPLGIGGSRVSIGPNLPGSESAYGAVSFDPSFWTGNAYKVGRSKIRYGFAIIDGSKLNGAIDVSEESDTVFYLQTNPTNIQQKEIFGTNVQATRKGVIVESEGVVFKDITISGNTGIFPGERGGSSTPSPNFGNLLAAPEPPAGVNASDGSSKRTGVTTVSGYQEFIALRQFFLHYAALKVSSKGAVFFAWLNQKDNEFFVVEPLEFVMDRDARSPLTYNYRISLRAIAKLDAMVSVKPEDSPLNIFDQIANAAANVTALIDSSNEVINASTALLTSITQALDNTFLTPVQQLRQALLSIRNGKNRVLSLPATLAKNAQSVSNFTLAVAESSEDVNTNSNNFATSQKATSSQIEGSSTSSTSGITIDDQGDVTNTGPSTQKASTSTAQDAAAINGKIPNILNDDGTLSKVLTPAQYTAVREVIEQLKNDPDVPLPRSFIEALKTNTVELRDNLADSIGAGDSVFNDIYGRTVTQPPPPLADPTVDQYRALGALQDIVKALDQILANNDFFQSDAEEIYTAANQTYGQVADIKKPDSVREATVELGDTLERIALREYGDALRWVDLVILNKLKAPYILTDTVVPKGVLRPGDKILIGNS